VGVDGGLDEVSCAESCWVGRSGNGSNMCNMSNGSVGHIPHTSTHTHNHL